MATIKDVADKAGVSVSTVSNMLNGKVNISNEKYNKIVQAIEELNYRPSIMARNLKNQRTNFIAVLLPNFEGHYATIFKGIQAILDKENYYIIPRATNDDYVMEASIISDVIDIGVCGLLVVPSNPDTPEIYDKLIRHNIPVIFVERHVDGCQFSSVVFDNHTPVRTAALEKIQQYGMDNVALVTGPDSYSSERDCVRGFKEAFSQIPEESVQQQDLTAFDSKIFQCSLNKEQAFCTLFDSLKLTDKMPKCFITSNVRVGEALCEILTLMENDAEVISLDSDDWCTSTSSQKSPKRIAREVLKLGTESTRMLIDYIGNIVLFENKVVEIDPPVRYEPDFDQTGVKWKKKLRVLLLESPTSDALIKMSAGYCKKYGREIEFEVLNYLDLHETTIKQLEGGRAQHDVLMVDLPWINSFVENNCLHDMVPLMGDNRTFLDDYPTAVRYAFMKNNSKIFGLPIMATIQFLFYRKDLFDNPEIKRHFNQSYGFDLKPPRNWTEFNIVAEFFNRSVNPLSPVEFGTSICGMNPTGIVDEFFPRQWAFGGRLLDENGKASMDSMENLRALNNLKTSYQLAPKECLGYWWDSEFKQLIDGRYAMIEGFASHFPKPGSADNIGTHYSDIGVVSLPGKKPMLGGWILGINRYSDAVEEGYSFIRWAISSERAVQNMLLGGAIPTKATCDNTAIRLSMPWMSDMRKGFASSGKREIVRNRRGQIIDPYWLDSLLSEYILKALKDEDTNEDVLSQLNAIISSVICEGGN